MCYNKKVCYRFAFKQRHSIVWGGCCPPYPLCLEHFECISQAPMDLFPTNPLKRPPDLNICQLIVADAFVDGTKQKHLIAAPERSCYQQCVRVFKVPQETGLLLLQEPYYHSLPVCKKRMPKHFCHPFLCLSTQTQFPPSSLLSKFMAAVLADPGVNPPPPWWCCEMITGSPYLACLCLPLIAS